MATKLETLKAKLEKQAKQLEELQKQVETEQLAELKNEEWMQKSAEILTAIAADAYAKFVEAGLSLPEGVVVTLTAGKDAQGADCFIPGRTTASKPKEQRAAGTGEKKASTGGARHTIVYEGKECSWADVADALGISYGAGSAHKAVFDKNRAVHDTIPHENCPYVKAAPAAEQTPTEEQK